MSTIGDVRYVDRRLLEGDAPDVAPQLLGTLLVAGECVGRIIEVEAYTRDDPASHSVRGQTARNASMFDRAGRLYVYLIYGIHHCANVVTGPVGDGQAVLVRALQPLAGIETMQHRRSGRTPLTGGPGTLCQALAIDRRHDGLDLCDPHSPITLQRDDWQPTERPTTGRRVGIRRATDVPWRWRITPG